MYPTRMAMNQWLPGDRAKNKIWRKLLLVTIILAFCLAIAMAWCACPPCQVEEVMEVSLSFRQTARPLGT